MNKNTKILYCILGSAILALLNSSVLSRSMLGIFRGGYGSSILGILLVGLINIVSFIGFISLGIFSVILIIRNIDFKDK